MIKKRFLIMGLLLLINLMNFVNADIKIINLKNNGVLNNEDVIRERNILLNVTLDEDAGFLLYALVKEKNKLIDFVKLCSVCKKNKEYTKRLTLGEGNNLIIVKDGADIQLIERTVKVDSKKPKITKIMPSSVGNDLFGIEITETNLTNVTFYSRFLKEPDYVADSLDIGSKCNHFNNSKYICTINENFKEGDLIQFFWEILDEVKKDSVFSNKKTITIDDSPPVLEIISPLEGILPTNFLLAVGSNELVKMTYQIDFQGKNNTLCNSCTYSERKLVLKEGEHTITVIGEDKAGNLDVQEKAFTIA